MKNKKQMYAVLFAAAVCTAAACGQNRTVSETPVSASQTMAPAAQTAVPAAKGSESDGEAVRISTDGKTLTYRDKTYQILAVDGGDMSGSRKPDAAVDIGYGSRVYWGLTNEDGQLVYALADKIVLQDSSREKVNAEGRYYNDEADVPGTEKKQYDKGHVIADSLGGVSNAYDITPEDSTLNRYGDQAYLEKEIRDAGGCTDLDVTITYPDTATQIPSGYRYEYTIQGNRVVDEFKNSGTVNESENPGTVEESAELAKIDTNHDGKVTIKEAKAAGYKMPVTSKEWLYKYMRDADGDGKIGG